MNQRRKKLASIKNIKAAGKGAKKGLGRLSGGLSGTCVLASRDPDFMVYLGSSEADKELYRDVSGTWESYVYSRGVYAP